MDPKGRTTLVVGATGHQGGAAAHHLLNDGWHVRALVRDVNKPAARALAELGAELVVGDLMDRASLDEAVRGAYGVYSMETPAGGAQVEEQEGRNIADAAAAAQRSLTSVLPRFSPRSIPMKAAGAFSSPSVTSSR